MTDPGAELQFAHKEAAASVGELSLLLSVRRGLTRSRLLGMAEGLERAARALRRLARGS